MRHADITTTLRVYTHVMKHRPEGVAERLDEALAGAEVGRNPHQDQNGAHRRQVDIGTWRSGIPVGRCHKVDKLGVTG